MNFNTQQYKLSQISHLKEKKNWGKNEESINKLQNNFRWPDTHVIGMLLGKERREQKNI